MRHRMNFPRVGKTALAAAALAGFLTLASAARLRADESECQHRVAAADHKLHEAGEHHGWDSKQAEHARQNLQVAREHCWNTYHRWWDEDGGRWHTERDWDIHD